MFKNKCYIKLPKRNLQEIEESTRLAKSIKTLLKRFGYKEIETLISGIQDNFLYIVCNSYKNGEYYISNINPEINKELIYCGDSKSLFLYITAVNDENAKYQLFTDGIRFEMCPDTTENIPSWEAMYRTIPHKANNLEIFDYCYHCYHDHYSHNVRNYDNNKTLYSMIIGNEEVNKKNYFAYLDYSSRYGWKFCDIELTPNFDENKNDTIWSYENGKFFYTSEEFKNLVYVIGNNLTNYSKKFSK